MRTRSEERVNIQTSRASWPKRHSFNEDALRRAREPVHITRTPCARRPSMRTRSEERVNVAYGSSPATRQATFNEDALRRARELLVVPPTVGHHRVPSMRTRSEERVNAERARWLAWCH